MNDGNIIDLKKTVEIKTAKDAQKLFDSGDIEELDLLKFVQVPEFTSLNKEYALIDNYGGGPSVLHETTDYNGNPMNHFMTTDSFKVINGHLRVSFSPGKATVPTAKLWLEWPEHRNYKGVIFDPSRGKEVDGYYNLYRGLSIEPKKGSWQHLKRHIYNIVCNGDRAKFHFIIKWLAFAVQYPGTPPGIAIILKGKEGAGKGMIFKPLLRIFGRHGYQVTSMKGVTGRFAIKLSETVVLFCDEALVSKDDTGELKGLITETTLALEPKNKETIVFDNRLHVCMSTNEHWIVPIGEDSRRFYINKVEDTYSPYGGMNSPATCKKYFDPIWEEINGDGTAAMLYDLLKVNLTGWNPIFENIRTDESIRQQDISSPTIDKAFYNFLQAGEFPAPQVKNSGDWKVKSSELRKFLKEQTPRLSNTSDRQIADILRDFGLEKRRANDGNYWSFLPLEDLRKRWCKKNKRSMEEAFPNSEGETWAHVEGPY